jgi:peptide/nickel transport system permease protein
VASPAVTAVTVPLLRKAGAALIVVFLASIVVFVGIRAIPGDPATALGGETGDPAQMQAIRHEYLLDRPLPEQYAHWIWLALHGNLGVDQRDLPVGYTIVHRLPLTLELATLSLLLAILIGVPAGVIAAVRRGRASDHVARFGALIGQSVPHFWLGLLLITWFAVDLNWLPAIGYVSMRRPLGNLEHLLMPVIVLGTGFAAVLMRQTRSGMLDSLGSDYVRTARAKGLSEWSVVGSHALRNSLITVVTLIALDFGVLISGAVVTETIFGIPGFGRLAIDAINERDYTMIQGIVLVTATAYVAINLLADLAYSLLDPRIRLAGAPK